LAPHGLMGRCRGYGPVTSQQCVRQSKVAHLSAPYLAGDVGNAPNVVLAWKFFPILSHVLVREILVGTALQGIDIDVDAKARRGWKINPARFHGKTRSGNFRTGVRQVDET